MVLWKFRIFEWFFSSHLLFSLKVPQIIVQRLHLQLFASIFAKDTEKWSSRQAIFLPYYIPKVTLLPWRIVQPGLKNEQSHRNVEPTLKIYLGSKTNLHVISSSKWWNSALKFFMNRSHEIWKVSRRLELNFLLAHKSQPDKMEWLLTRPLSNIKVTRK